jgi:hypothetical protein
MLLLYFNNSPNKLLSKLIAIADVLYARKSITKATAYSAALTLDRNTEEESGKF